MSLQSPLRLDTTDPTSGGKPADRAATVIYDAFISYSHAKDKPLAATLQSAIQRLGKPWYRRRALHLFRDDTSLSASPHLWPSIERALERSRFLILMASPEAATSPWVDKEVAWWLDHHSPDTLLIALCDGELAWDGAAGDFAGSATIPLPPALAGRVPDEPFWIDLRPYREDASPRDTRFADLAADFAATIRGMPKEDLLSEEVRQQRGALRLAGSAVALLVVLLGLAGWQWHVAQLQRDRAEHTLALATETASGLIFDLEQKFRDAGVPAAAIEGILARVRKLQEQLTQGGETSAMLRLSQVQALLESADSLLTLGDTKDALASAQQGHTIMRALLAAAPDRTDYRFLLSASDEKIGEALMAQGDSAGALAAYRDALSLRKALAIADLSNSEWQIDLSISEERTGDALAAQGDLAGALAAYRDAFLIRKELVRTDSNNMAWQRDLSVSDEKIGDVLVAQGDLAGALSVYRDGLAIAKALAEKDSSNTLWQRDLSVSNNKIGEVLKGQGDLAGALAAYRDSLASTKALAQKDPGNREWQRDLAVAEESIGDVLKAQGDLVGALAAYRDKLSIAQALAQRDPDNMLWQRDLAVAGHKIGSVLIAQGNLDTAVAAEREAVAVIRRAYAAHPAAAVAKEGLARALGGLSWVLLLADRPREALDSTQEALILDPSLLFVRTNQAHALLLLGRFDAAKAIYVEDKNKPRDAGKTLAGIVRDDFAEFRKFGIDTPDMKRIETLFSG